MKPIIVVPAALVFFSTPVLGAEGFKRFSDETKRLTAEVPCPNSKVTPAGFGMGALYGCIMGKAQTAKLWVNESSSKPGVVENVKVMWNDWYKDVGYGLHPDQREALRMLEVVTKLFAPSLKTKVEEAFSSGPGTKKNFEQGPFQFEVKVTRGPAIDERLITVTHK